MKRLLPTLQRTIAILVALIIGTGTVFAAQFSEVCPSGQTLYYNVINTTAHYVQITYPGNYSTPYPSNYPKPTGNITLPSTVTHNDVTYTVVMIGAYAFKDCTGLTGSLTIPNSVTEIGYYAFDGCTGFTGNLIIGNSVEKIDYDAFHGCSGFTGLTLGNALSEIGYAAFSGCSGFTGSLTIPNAVTTIDGYAFYNCTGFTDLTLGSSLTTIGMSAFSYCTGFTGSLIIPDAVTAILGYAFSNCTGFTGSLTLGNAVTSIGEKAFHYCTGFTGPLVIPDGVIEIGDNAFSYSNGFTGLTIGNSVTTIGSSAFAECRGLRSATIGNSVTTIGNSAFSGCYYLAAVTVLPETPPTLGTSTFSSAQSYFRVYVPCGSLEDYQTAPVWNGYNILCLPETLTVYDGTVANEYVPAYIYYFDEFTRSQFVIPAADLMEMAGTAISSMTFYTMDFNIPYTAVSGTYVYLKEVDFTEINAFEPRSSATTVFGGYLNIENTGTGGVMTINFNTPYTYHGGNLLVGIENPEANDYEEIYFYGQNVNGASISNHNADDLNSVVPTQRNFIPKTTFSYHPTSAPQSLPYFYSFEEEEELDRWTMLDCDSGTGTHVSAAHSGNMGFQFRDNTNPPQYLISPKLEGTEEVNVSFYYRNDIEYYPESFQVGYSTTTKTPDAFTWGTELTAADPYAWARYENTFPVGTRYVAVKLTSNDNYYLYLDDFSFNPVFCQPEDQCLLVFELRDEYGDGWEGNAIKVTDDETGAVLAMMANDHFIDNGWADTQTKFLYACNGRDVRFEWVRGGSPGDCSFFITDDNGEQIIEFEDCSDLETGDFLEDYLVRCGVVTQTISLSSGINWFSANVDITLDDLKAALVEALPNTVITIKASGSSTSYKPNMNRWIGQLGTGQNVFTLTQLYMITVTADAEITLEGLPIDVTGLPITIKKGANWISYPLTESMTLDDAFAGFAVNGDVVKGQNGSARRTGPRWSGQLKTLEPGQGYIFTSSQTADRTFTFPAGK